MTETVSRNYLHASLDIRHPESIRPGPLSVIAESPLPLGALNASDVPSGPYTYCQANGQADTYDCVMQAFANTAHQGNSLVNFPGGTYGTTKPIVVPNKMHMNGTGRGDPGGMGTTFIALPGFPVGQPVIQLGEAPGPDFDVWVSNLTVDCNYNTSVGISNQYAEEMSGADHVLISRCYGVGLSVTGGGAQNSGPYSNLEIYPGGGKYVTGNSLCVLIDNVVGFRGLDAVTCNPGSYYSQRPWVGIQLNGAGSITNSHVEHAANAIALGSKAMAADAVIIQNMRFGPDIGTGVLITNPGPNNENISMFALGCAGCQKALLEDRMTGNIIRDPTIGFYLLGNGGGGGKNVWSSNSGVGLRTNGNVMQVTGMIGPVYGPKKGPYR